MPESPTLTTVAATWLCLALVGCATDLDCEAIGAVERDGTCVNADAAVDAGDACEGGACPAEAGSEAGVADRDGDGIPDDEDNCPDVANADQLDRDGDGQGDACDEEEEDDGGDDDGGGDDECPPGEAQDGGGCANGNEGEDEDVDSDGDGIPDEEDNCPDVPNPDQADQDMDGRGDACPLDSDGDGIPDEEDNCPLDHAGEADIDGDGCPLELDACPTGGWVGPDTDQDGCLDIEDPAPENASIPARPEIVYVDATAPSAGADGSSWSTAFPFLQDAIAAANEAVLAGPPAEIWIAKGVYYPDDSTSDPSLHGDHTASFAPRTGVRMIGGFEELDTGWGRPPDAMAETVLSGDIGHDDHLGIIGRNSCHVIGGEIETSDAAYSEELYLDGVEVTAGDATHHSGSECEGVTVPGTSGGGILSAGTATLIRVRVRGNRASHVGGGAAFIQVPRVDMVDSSFEGNAAPRAAALHADNARLHGVRVVGNTASGGAVTSVVWLLHSRVVNSVVAGNSSEGNNAIIAWSMSSDFLSTTFVGNATSPTADQASIFVASTSSSGEKNGLSHVLSQGNAPWSSDLGLNQQTLVFSMIQDLPFDYPGNIRPLPPLSNLSGATLFRAPVLSSAAPTTTGDLRLSRTSTNPAVDAGSTVAPTCPPETPFAPAWDDMAMPDGTPICADGLLQVDADGNPRLQGSAVDIGAYELAK